ncbi:hypothetical protein ACFY2K_42535 [Kitasatospora sp. NPDC001309]|uniref:hypothetical protein n=1 Tax=Kitasatospora sp. NPDC001309 TaxID=3364013 RepID=UPI00369C971C
MTSLLGPITATGVCLVIMVWLLVGHRGKGTLAEQHKDHHTAWWMLLFGLFAQGAGQTFEAPKVVGDSLTAAMNHQFNAGAGATALILVIVLFGTKPRVWKDVIVGGTLPAAAVASGSILALPFTVVGSFFHGLIGA